MTFEEYTAEIFASTVESFRPVNIYEATQAMRVSIAFARAAEAGKEDQFADHMSKWIVENTDNSRDALFTEKHVLECERSSAELRSG